jgi:lysophospholipase L1-like esterase
VKESKPVAASSVVILGDSLSAQSTDAYAASLPGVTVDAFPGRTLVSKTVSDTAMDRIADLKITKPAWWVVALGTNDAAYGEHSPEVMAADIETVLKAIGDDQCVLWVLPAIGPPATQGWIDNVAAFGDIVRFAFGSRSCGALVDWQLVVASERDILKDDGIHLTKRGERRLAEVVLDGLIDAGALNPT